MAAHTSGPWAIEPRPPGQKVLRLLGTRIEVDYDDVDHEEQLANAQLIAAAPDMLAACEALADWRGMFDANTLETWERIAEQFRKETDYLRPGKDTRLPGPTDAERAKAWGDWCERKNAELNQQLRAAIAKAKGETNG